MQSTVPKPCDRFDRDFALRPQSFAKALTAGKKVVVEGKERFGFGQVSSYWQGDACCSKFVATVNSVSFTTVATQVSSLHCPLLPAQTRCYQEQDGIIRYGRVLICQSEALPLRTYLIRFADNKIAIPLREDQFFVADPTFAQAIQSMCWLNSQTRHRSSRIAQPSCGNSSVSKASHTACQRFCLRKSRSCNIRPRSPNGFCAIQRFVICSRTKWVSARLSKPASSPATPTRRAGHARGVFAPNALVRQWRDELDGRFSLNEVPVFHTRSSGQRAGRDVEWDMLVIDEAHRVVARTIAEEDAVAAGARCSPVDAKHLLLLSATPAVAPRRRRTRALELLDPANYSRVNLVAFKKRMERRIELGRAFLALRSAKVPALVKLNAGTLARFFQTTALVGISPRHRKACRRHASAPARTPPPHQ